MTTHRAPVPDMAAEEPHQGTARPSVSLSGLGSALASKGKRDLLPPRERPATLASGFVEALRLYLMSHKKFERACLAALALRAVLCAVLCAPAVVHCV